MSRKVVVFSMQDNSKEEIYTNAETWGQVKQENSKINSMSRGMKVTIKESRTTVESDESVLPDGDVTLFLFPAKVKAGNNENAEKIIEDYTEKFSTDYMNAVEKDLLELRETLVKSVEQ